MNSYENLSTKELDNVEKNLLKQIERVRNERKSRNKDSEQQSSSTLASVFKISLFSNKTEDKKEVKVKVDKEKAKAEKEKEKEKAKAEKEKEKEKAKAEKEKEKEKAKAEKEKATKKESSDNDKQRPIKATISSMKEVLDYHHIDYPSNAKKDDLAKLLRENTLVREAEKKEANKKADK